MAKVIEVIEALLGQPIQRTDEIKKAIEQVDSFKQECQELGKHVEMLGKLLRAIARLRGSGCLCERPTNRIMLEVSRTLDKCLALVKRCKKGGILRRVITITSATDFKKVIASLENSVGDVKWLLNVSNPEEDTTEMGGLPPILSTDPMLALVWVQIARVQGGNPKVKEEGASYLATLAVDGERTGKLIVEEGGVPPLLGLLKDGTLEAQHLAATALGTLAIHQERVQQIVAEGVIPAFVQTLTDGTMRVQAKVAWALAEMVSHDPDAQRDFGLANAIKPLVALMLETIDHSFATPPPVKAISMHSLVNKSMAVNRAGTEVKEGNPAIRSDVRNVKEGIRSMSGGRIERGETHKDQPAGVEPVSHIESSRSNHKGQHTRSISDSLYHGLTARDISRKEREKEAPEIKMELKAQVTRALWKLAQNNPKNSRMIADTRASLLGLAKLIELEQGEVQRNAIMAVMELAAAAEKDADLKRLAFKTTSPAAKAVVDQLLRMIKDSSGELDVQVTCIKAVGCLARTFPVRESKVIRCLVMKLNNFDIDNRLVAAEAATALIKFVEPDNFLHKEHSQTIVEAPALPYLVQLAALDEDKRVQVPALILLCHLALHVGRTSGNAFREAAALSVLQSVGASTNTTSHLQHIQSSVGDLIHRAIRHLELYEAGGDSHPHMSHY